ncbi:hypothetical protein QL285_061755 [Trifolium repens]|nr:hypothetical protein QL285_061755 [Trifolium repens]
MAILSNRSNSFSLCCLNSFHSSLTNSKVAPLLFFLPFFLAASLPIGRALDPMELESLASLSWALLDPQLPEPVLSPT